MLTVSATVHAEGQQALRWFVEVVVMLSRVWLQSKGLIATSLEF